MVKHSEEIIEALSRGGVHHLESIASREQLLRAISDRLEAVPAKSLLFELLLEREQVVSTAVGHGVALPHPRNAKLLHLQKRVVGCFYLDPPIDYDARDGEPVWCFFVLICLDTASHLRTMRELAHCLRQPEFMTQLLQKPDLEGLTQMFAECAGK